jgi:hypothetical protein
VTSRPARAAQEGPLPSREDAYKGLLAMLAAHLDCRMEQVGRCVYCKTHRKRLWQGTVMSESDKAEIRAECERLGVPVGGTDEA